MSKKNDDSIERIFRKAVTQYEPTFVESDWQKMEKMLDEEASRRAVVRSKRIRGAAYTVTGLLGLITMVYFLAFNNPSGSVERVNPLSPRLQAEEGSKSGRNVQKEESSSGLLSSSDKDSARDEASGKTPITATESIKQEDQEKKYSTDEHPNASLELTKPFSAQEYRVSQSHPKVKNSDSIDNPSSDLFTVAEGENARDGADELHPDSPAGFKEREETHDANSITPKAFASTDDSTRNPLVQPASSVPFDSRTADNEKSFPGEEKEALSEINTMKGKSTRVYSDTTSQQLLLNLGNEIINANAGNSTVKQQKDTTTFTQVIDVQKGFAKTDSLQEKPAEDKQQMKSSSRLSLGILFAPEFSTTRLNHYSAPGSSLGLRIGYQVSRKFSLNTGIIRSSKKYKDEASEYNTNPGYWKYRTNGVVPSEIYGECLVLEVPLDIQFDAIQTQNSRVFVSAGMSSYFMLSQSYDYHFETPNPGADKGWSTSESESYWFGIGTISTGYERKIHPALMIGIEPYLKIALTEIGWPNINLLSTGAYITLRYKFVERGN